MAKAFLPDSLKTNVFFSSRLSIFNTQHFTLQFFSSLSSLEKYFKMKNKKKPKTKKSVKEKNNKNTTVRFALSIRTNVCLSSSRWFRVQYICIRQYKIMSKCCQIRKKKHLRISVCQHEYICRTFVLMVCHF